MRTFTFSDDRSHKFWNIELQGNAFTVTYGRIGTAGQTQQKSFRDDAAAQKEHDKLVAEKLKKGYRETTPSAKPAVTSLRESLEQALVENPDDLASHMAYADYLTEQDDPLGEFIRVQLALEDESRSAADRKKLKQQEEKLLKAHQETWLGGLAPYLVNPKKHPRYEWRTISAKFSFARGWLDTLEAENYTVEFTRALAKAPQARLLRRLELTETPYEEANEYPPGDDVPEDAEWPQLYPLVKCPYLTNVRCFVLGNTAEAEGDCDEGGFSCHTEGDGAVGVIKQMPRVEELDLLAHGIDADQLYSLRTLDRLRVLLHYHGRSYPLGRLAKNPSLGKLTHLLCHPHAIEDEAYIQLPAVRALARSTSLPALTHLRLRLSDSGDAGVRELIDSGLLGRLKSLDLSHGRVTDEGARALAACPDLKKLESLALGYNCLTDDGLRVLRATGVPLQADSQWRATGDEYDDRMYLCAGDIE